MRASVLVGVICSWFCSFTAMAHTFAAGELLSRRCPFVPDIFTVSPSTFFGRTIRVVSIIPRLVGDFCAGQGPPVDADISDSAVEEVILPEPDSQWRLVR